MTEISDAVCDNIYKEILSKLSNSDILFEDNRPASIRILCRWYVNSDAEVVGHIRIDDGYVDITNNDHWVVKRYNLADVHCFDSLIHNLRDIIPILYHTAKMSDLHDIITDLADYVGHHDDYGDSLNDKVINMERKVGGDGSIVYSDSDSLWNRLEQVEVFLTGVSAASMGSNRDSVSDRLNRIEKIIEMIAEKIGDEEINNVVAEIS